MRLICMAHRGEAQEFLKNLDMSTQDSKFHLGETESLLITGEGPFEVLALLPYYIAKYGIKEIVNYGIAGSLSPKLEIGEIYSIRTTYAYGLNKPRFQSFSTASSSQSTSYSMLDCITTEQRVLSDSFAKELDSFAEIVDRELWAIGKVASTYKIPFKAFKLISDYAGNSTNCFDLKKMAKTFSQRMFYFHKEQHFTPKELPCQQELNLPFKASFTQTKRIESLIKKLQNDLNPLALLEEASLSTNQSFQLGSVQKNSKETANQFISFLERKINPINSEIETKLQELISPIKEIGGCVFYDKKFESQKITLKMDINDQKNIDKLILALSEFKFSSVENLWSGKFDV